MSREFTQLEWDDLLVDDCRQLVRLAVREDLDRFHDWTTLALISEEKQANASIVARDSGVISGLRAAEIILDEMNVEAEWQTLVADGTQIEAATAIARLSGNARDLLTAERLLLNFIGRMSGIATLTQKYTSAVANSKARIYDTRKTTPAWRRLDKYAVKCGDGSNHRTGLFDAILIKDNHLAFAADEITPTQAVAKAKEFAALQIEGSPDKEPMIIEIEVDSLDQLRDVLPSGPDIVLLDNMTPEQLREAVTIRDAKFPSVELEASGGVNLSTVAEIAQSGVDRISIGALTHSAPCLDVGMDWNAES